MARRNKNKDNNKNKNKRCKLLEIAPELRNRIYNEIFPQGAITVVDSKYELPPLLKTCKQLHDEATCLFYASTTFLCLDEGTASPFLKWYKSLPSQYSSLIPKFRYISTACAKELEMTSMHVEGGNFDGDSWEVYTGKDGLWQNVGLAMIQFEASGIDLARTEVPCLNGVKSWEWQTLEKANDETLSAKMSPWIWGDK